MTVEEWLNNEELPITIWKNKYRHGDENFEQWLNRVSGGDGELEYYIRNKIFLFGGRTLANKGTNKKGSYSNCYSIGYVPDSLEGILKANSDIALTFKAQGGQGLSLSKIRPKGASINNQFKSDGIVPFMEMFNTTTSSISQGGSRKGALLMSLDIWHKEAEDFITIKSKEGKIEKANLSLEIDDEFMNYVKEYYENGINRDITVVRTYEGKNISYSVNPVKLYKLMMDTVYDWGEPGCIFTNKFRNYNLMEFCPYYNIETCNPCGEQPLAPYSACNLGSINVSKFVENPFTNPKFNFSRFRKAVRVAVRALDTVLDENLPNHALPEQRKMSENYRNVGLGIMGLADALIMMKLIYGSSAAQDFCIELMQAMLNAAVAESIELAKEKGSFPKYSENIWEATIIKNNIDKEIIEEGKKYGLRNCSLLSIAPTGSLATMLNGISGGCEPYFALEYNRTTKSLNGDSDKTYKQYAPIVQLYRTLYPDGPLPDYFVTSENIHWKARLEMQSALQYACDTAISSTVNLPENTPKEDIEQLYLEAWALGLKGITVFRSGCKRTAILSTNKPKEEKKFDSPGHLTENAVFSKPTYDTIVPVSRKQIGITYGSTFCKKCACGTLYITVNRDAKGNIVEVFTHTSKGGICQANTNAITRMASMALRSGVKVDEVVDQLKGIKCPACLTLKAKGEKLDGISCPDILSKTIEEFSKLDCCIADEESDDVTIEDVPIQLPAVHNYVKCPKCGMALTAQGGCFSCQNCGYSKCE